MKKILIVILCLTALCSGARIKHGDTSRKVGFVAADSTDFFTREASLTNVVVYYSIDGGTATVMTSPTVTAADVNNMTGDFWLSIDEAAMVIVPAGCDEVELIINITATEMTPATKTVEVYRKGGDAVILKKQFCW